MKLLLFLLTLSSLTALAQNPAYDSLLAKRTGADEIGMKKYVFAILKTGPTKVEDKAKLNELFAGHMATIGRLADEGKIVMAGPFMNEKEYRGLIVYNVTSKAEAQQLAEADPAIKAGIFVVELRDWYSSAALMTITETHKKLVKKP